jgi:hypothetical protein
MLMLEYGAVLPLVDKLSVEVIELRQYIAHLEEERATLLTC